MKSCLFYSNMRVKLNLWIFIWLLTVKMVNGFGYVNQEEVKSQFTGCLNICVKLCKAFGETRLDLKMFLFAPGIHRKVGPRDQRIFRKSGPEQTTDQEKFENAVRTGCGPKIFLVWTVAGGPWIPGWRSDHELCSIDYAPWIIDYDLYYDL